MSGRLHNVSSAGSKTRNSCKEEQLSINLLEEKDMRLGLVDLVMLPTKTLPRTVSKSWEVLPYACVDSVWLCTCVMPIARHSSSQRSFRVPLDLSW